MQTTYGGVEKEFEMSEYITGGGTASNFIEFTTPEKYIEKKLKILLRDFKIRPSYKEVDHLYSLKTQTAIDNAFHKIIFDYLDNYDELFGNNKKKKGRVK